MRLAFSCLLLFSLSQQSFAARPDSVKFRGTWYKIYPYDYSVTCDRKLRPHKQPEAELFVPFETLPDGQYIQLYHFELQIYRSWRHSDRRQKKEERYNQKIEELLVPHAVFSVQNGKINGDAVFFLANKKPFFKGTYQDNLKEGKWFYGNDFKNYKSYSSGLLNGESYYAHSSKHGSTVSYYQDGILLRSTSMRTYKKSVFRDEFVYFPKDSSSSLVSVQRSYQDDKLTKELHKTYLRNYDTLFTFYPNGNLRTVQTYLGGSDNSLNSLFYFWANHFPIGENENIVLYDVFYYKHGRKSFELKEYLKKDIHRMSYQLRGKTTQYYPNGNKQITLSTIYNTPTVDTLFYENGKPRYYAYLDDTARTYVALYFDSNGVKTDQYIYKIPPPLVPEKISVPQETYKFRGYTLYPYRSYDNSLYYYRADLPQLNDERKADTITFFIEHEKKAGTRVLSYDLKERKRTEFYTNEKTGDEYCGYTLIYRFDSTYTNAEATYVFQSGTEFQIKNSFVISCQSLAPNENLIPNWYDLERTLERTPFTWNLNKSRAINTVNLPALPPLIDIHISQIQTEYLWNGAPYSGQLEFIFGKNKLKTVADKNKLSIHLTRGFLGFSPDPLQEVDPLQNVHSYLESPLIPELYFYLPDRSYDGAKNIPLNHSVGNYSYYSTGNLRNIQGHVQNGMLNGELTFNFSFPHYSDTLNFVQGKPEGTMAIYGDAYKAKPFKRFSYVFTKGTLEAWYQYDSFGDTLFSLTGINSPETELDLIYIDYVRRLDFETKKTFYIQQKDISSARYENGELKELKLTEIEEEDSLTKSIKFNGLWETDTFQISNFDGYFRNGQFNGTLSTRQGDKDCKKMFSNGQVIQEKTFSDSILLWVQTLDTNQVSLRYELIPLYTNFPWIKLPHQLYMPDSNVIRFTSEMHFYYADGTTSAQGKNYCKLRLSRDIWGSIEELLDQFNYNRCGTWKFYNPSGQLSREVVYPGIARLSEERYPVHVNPSPSANGQIQASDSVIVRKYVNGSLRYQARMSFVTHFYDCNSDRTDEVMDLIIEYDVLPDGSLLPYPTRHHRNFYDTGVLQSEGEIIQGKQEGLWYYYDPQGKLFAVGSFQDGKRDGRWISGDLQGIPFLGDLCLNPDLASSEDFMKSLTRDVTLDITVYNRGLVVETKQMTFYRNN